MASSGTTKECAQCGADKFRYEFQAGSEVCRACEMDGDRMEDNPLLEHPMAQVALGGAVEGPEPAVEHGLEEWGGLRVSQVLLGEMRALMGVAEDEELDLDRFVAEHAIVGSPRERAWWQTTCFPRGTGVLNLEVVRAFCSERLRELEQLRARAYDQGAKGTAPVTWEDVSLAVAAEVIYHESYPDVREHLDIAMEVTGEGLDRIIMGVLGRDRDSLHSPDFSLVPDRTPVERVTPVRPAGPAQQPVQQVLGREVDASGNFLRTCKCCGETFSPKKGVPNSDFCSPAGSTESECGAFDHALHTWAGNAVRYASEGMDRAPLPEPEDWLRHCRTRPEGFQRALTFRDSRVQFWLEDARRQFSRTVGAA